MYADTQNLLAPQAEATAPKKMRRFLKQPDDVAIAIRKGIEIRPAQCFGAIHKTDPFDGPASCALGAAYDGGLSRKANILNLRVTFPCDCKWYSSLSNKPGRGRLGDTIMHLNDSHRWTREQIADWLDTLAS